MLKYLNVQETFTEVPDEISLCINLSKCPIICEGCHSKWLWQDIGVKLGIGELKKLIKKHIEVSCICFMGGDANPKEINMLAEYLKKNTHYKVAWYSGKNHVDSEIQIEYFDYIKLGPYVKSLGGLASSSTNQVFLKIENITGRFIKGVE